MDLFQQFDALFRGQTVEAPPQALILNRWLSSDPDFAAVAKQLAPKIYDAKMNWEIWVAILPRAAGAPRLKYPAPTRPKAAEKLVEVMMSREKLRREVAEMYCDTMNVVQRMEACRYYGIEVDTDDEPEFKSAFIKPIVRDGFLGID